MHLVRAPPFDEFGTAIAQPRQQFRKGGIAAFRLVADPTSGQGAGFSPVFMASPGRKKEKF